MNTIPDSCNRRELQSIESCIQISVVETLNLVKTRLEYSTLSVPALERYKLHNTIAITYSLLASPTSTARRGRLLRRALSTLLADLCISHVLHRTRSARGRGLGLLRLLLAVCIGALRLALSNGCLACGRTSLGSL